LETKEEHEEEVEDGPEVAVVNRLMHRLSLSLSLSLFTLVLFVGGLLLPQQSQSTDFTLYKECLDD
jgi:hypothetical protein